MKNSQKIIYNALRVKNPLLLCDLKHIQQCVFYIIKDEIQSSSWDCKEKDG